MPFLLIGLFVAGVVASVGTQVYISGEQKEMAEKTQALQDKQNKKAEDRAQVNSEKERAAALKNFQDTRASLAERISYEMVLKDRATTKATRIRIDSQIEQKRRDIPYYGQPIRHA